MPPHEWPTKTTLPVCPAIARFVAATSAAREVNGFCTATTFRPWACSNGTTLFHSDPSTNAPCTSTTVVAGVVADATVGIVKPASIVNASSKFRKLGTVIRIIYSFQGFGGQKRSATAQLRLLNSVSNASSTVVLLCSGANYIM